VKKDDKIKDGLSHFGQRIIILRGFEIIFALLFIIILSIDLCTSRIDAHNILITICLVTLIFFTIQNNAFTTLRWLLNDSSQSPNSQ